MPRNALILGYFDETSRRLVACSGVIMHCFGEVTDA
jgi:hypothetical protein